MAEALTSTTVNTKLQQIAQRAREAPDLAFNNLAHLIDRDFLLEAFRRTRKDGAPGVDGCIADDYARNMVTNLDGLLEGVKEGRYQAPPVRRVHIPKDDIHEVLDKWFNVNCARPVLWGAREGNLPGLPGLKTVECVESMARLDAVFSATGRSPAGRCGRKAG